VAALNVWWKGKITQSSIKCFGMEKGITGWVSHIEQQYLLRLWDDFDKQLRQFSYRSETAIQS
jgi:hypothetical protein